MGTTDIAEHMSDGERSSTAVTLTATGVTLLGVLLSIGVTVGLGVSAAWWVRLVVGGGATVALVVVVKVTTRKGRGPLARLANWTISAPPDGSGR